MNYDKNQDPAIKAPPATLGSVLNDLDERLGVAHELADKLRAIGDRLHGGAPRDVSPSVARAEPVALLARLEGRRDALGHVLSAIAEEIGRIERAL